VPKPLLAAALHNRSAATVMTCSNLRRTVEHERARLFARNDPPTRHQAGAVESLLHGADSPKIKAPDIPKLHQKVRQSHNSMLSPSDPGDQRTTVTDFPHEQNCAATSLLPSGDARRPAVDREDAEEQGAYVANGHSVLGILNGPRPPKRTELIVDGVASSTDLTPFDPIRLRSQPRYGRARSPLDLEAP
jgi:hypothetical protein